MIKTINFSEFCDAFKSFERDNFTYNGQRALFDYLERLEEIQQNYTAISSIYDLRDTTQVIEFDGGIIIEDF